MRSHANCSQYPAKKIDPRTAALLESLGVALWTYIETRRPDGCSTRDVARWLSENGHRLKEGTLRAILGCMHINGQARVKYRYRKKPRAKTLRALRAIPDFPVAAIAVIDELLKPPAPWAPQMMAA